MKKYKKPVLDIVEFDNMDVIVMSNTNTGGEGSDTGSNDSVENEMSILKETDDSVSGEPASGSDETAGSGVTNQDSEGPADEELASPEETLAPQGTESDTDEPDTQSESQSDDDGLS